MQHRSLVASCALLALVGIQPASAVRIVELVERSYELRLSDASLPLSVGGSVTFKACSECPTESIAVTQSTAYFLTKTQQVALADFRQHAQALVQQGAATRTLLMVHYDIDTRRATRLRMTTFPAR